MKKLFNSIKKKIQNVKFELWHSYLIPTGVFWQLVNEKKLTRRHIELNSIKKITKPSNKFLIAADPFFLSDNELLFESLSIINGKGAIFLYKLVEKEFKRLALDHQTHYSFPRSLSIRKDTYLTFECSSKKGLCIYKIKNRKNMLIQKIETNQASIDRLYNIIDPILTIEGDNINLICSSLESENKARYLFSSALNMNDLNFELKECIYAKKFDKSIAGAYMRNAGGPLRFNNQVYYPLQTKKRYYGDGIWLLKSNQLSGFAEIRIKRSQGKNYYGPHTINYSPDEDKLAIDIYSRSILLSPLKVIWLTQDILRMVATLRYRNIGKGIVNLIKKYTS